MPSHDPIHYQDGSPYTRAVREGYDGRVAEVTILSSGGGSFVPTPDRSARTWSESPDHTAVILDPLREDLGVGCFQVYYDESELGVLLTIFCVAELAEPF